MVHPSSFLCSWCSCRCTIFSFLWIILDYNFSFYILLVLCSLQRNRQSGNHAMGYKWNCCLFDIDMNKFAYMIPSGKLLYMKNVFQLRSAIIYTINSSPIYYLAVKVVVFRQYNFPWKKIIHFKLCWSIYFVGSFADVLFVDVLFFFVRQKL